MMIKTFTKLFHRSMIVMLVSLAVVMTISTSAVFAQSALDRRAISNVDAPVLISNNTTSLRAPLDSANISFLEMASGLSSPVFITHAGDGTGRIFIVEQTGIIRILKNGTLLETPFLDVHSIIKSGGETGLLALAFHPSYGTNGIFFVVYTGTRSAGVSAGDLVLEKFSVSANPDLADPASGVILLIISHPQYSNHNGGTLAFGADGYLYWSTGDGGSGGEHGQQLNNLLGKILRIDVNSGSLYEIPTSNPFYSSVDPNVKKEIWAYGLRNPWRLSFDRLTHDLYIGDVGQSTREEVDFQPAGSPGGENYGWSVMEGSRCYIPPSACDQSGKILPVAEYTHSVGCSISGGYVYRGSKFPSLAGYYFYGDYCSGRLYSLYNDPTLGWTAVQVADTPYNISTFGEDEQGELYLADLGSGKIFNIRYQELPKVNSSVRNNANPTAAASVNFTVTFSGPVSGVDMTGPIFDDFSLSTNGVSGATVSGVSGSGSVYTVTVDTGSGNGTLRLDVVDNNTIVDEASNPLGGVGLGDGDFNGGETYDIEKLLLLTVIKTGKGSGTVISDPIGINCGLDCSETYNDNTSITLTALADSGSIFTGWSGGGCSGAGTCTVSMNLAQSISANFSLNLPDPFGKSSPANGLINQLPSLTLSWGSSSGATSYEYCYDKTNNNACTTWVKNGVSTTKLLSGLIHGTTYYWHVRAKNAGGVTYSDASPTAFWSFKIGSLPSAPLLISPVTNTFTLDTAPSFIWNSAANGITYEIQIDDSAAFTAPIIQSHLGASGELSYGASALPDKAYYWRVRAYNVNNEPGAWSAGRKITIDTSAPLPPGLKAPMNAASVRGTPKYSWIAARTAYRYQFEYDDDGNFSSPIYTSPELTILTHKPPTQAVGAFNWHVRVRDLAGNWSPWSLPRTITILPLIPAAPVLASPASATTILENTPTLSWNPVPYGNTYQIQIATNSTFTQNPQTITTGVGALSITLDPLANGRYYWRVRAMNVNGGIGAWSTARYFTVSAP